MSDFLTTQQIIEAAHHNLSEAAWDYLVGGAEAEVTLRRNRIALDKWGFIPRVLRDVSHVNTSATLFGHKLRSPVILAPIGSMQHLSPDGAIGFAQAASRYGTMMSMSIMTPPGLEDVAAAGESPKLFQLYMLGDLAWARDILARVREAGYDALCLTVDTPYHSRRDRSIVNPMPGRRPGARGHEGPNYLASVTWETLDRLRQMWDRPFILKGVMSPLDAAKAVEHGVDAVWVSNHGGRQLDQTVGTMDVLPRIVDAVADRATVIFDGGVLRGTDVVKALCLGADVVGVGKLQGFGMAAGGVEGLVRALEILEEETRMAMSLLGVTSVTQLDATYVERSDPVLKTHDTVAWPDLPGGRFV
jgi:glycolate oxidase